MIVTLAGHVDHGKTSLVQALTGVDTDRLAEEKARGLTIDLGFAYIDDGAIGFVDVPGHHKFIHNMVAGVAANQLALLVIAADDGPMPQSREHLDILSLVGIERGVIAMTKTDRVDAARQADCEAEIRNLVAGTFLESAPVIPTSVQTPATVATLLDVLRSHEAATPAGNNGFRLAVDRAFNVRGAGLVVTGTVHDGQVNVDDTLTHFPSGRSVRVRGLRAQDQEVTAASTGERCAINIAGMDLADVGRGDWLTGTPREIWRELTVELDVLPGFPRAVRHWTPVHVYHATSHTTARLALHDNQRIAPGSRALADLILDEPLAVQHDDRLVIRDHSLDTTLGGGRVVHAQTTVTRRRRSEVRLRTLQAHHCVQPIEAVDALLAQGGFDIHHFQALWQIPESELAQLLKDRGALTVDGHAITQAHLGELAKTALKLVQTHTAANPSSPGLRENAFTEALGAFARQVLGALVRANRLQVQGGLYSLPAHEAELPEALAGLWQRLEPELDVLQPPSSGDLAKQWRIPQAELEKNLKELTRRGRLTFIGEHRYFLPRQLRAIAGIVTRLAQRGPFSVKQFRNETGIGRNVAINILEYFDGRGFTRREGNERVVQREDLAP